MARSKSSGRWLKEHFDDHYVKADQTAGYRSRAAFKLLEIQEKDHILKPKQVIVDLGAAPGGWSQVAANIIGDAGHIIALDLLPMDNIADVAFIQGDFTDAATFEQLMQQLGNQQVDVVLSDMAPNMSGNRSVDQPRAMHLVELVIDFAQATLKTGGTMLVKVFQGEGFDNTLHYVRTCFAKVVIRKPDASRARSREQYWLATGFKGKQ